MLSLYTMTHLIPREDAETAMQTFEGEDWRRHHDPATHEALLDDMQHVLTSALEPHIKRFQEATRFAREGALWVEVLRSHLTDTILPVGPQEANTALKMACLQLGQHAFVMFGFDRVGGCLEAAGGATTAATTEAARWGHLVCHHMLEGRIPTPWFGQPGDAVEHLVDALDQEPPDAAEIAKATEGIDVEALAQNIRARTAARDSEESRDPTCPLDSIDAGLKPPVKVP